ncbi:hypothetical protein AB1Y20_009550 [Prymnesium parvum]|uniref:Uncharacterized protein n=1 Tax=Prymnesium parvum TaxID=97485 RepID=A0AB34K557_PRYPA
MEPGDSGSSAASGRTASSRKQLREQGMADVRAALKRAREASSSSTPQSAKSAADSTRVALSASSENSGAAAWQERLREARSSWQQRCFFDVDSGDGASPSPASASRYGSSVFISGNRGDLGDLLVTFLIDPPPYPPASEGLPI